MAMFNSYFDSLPEGIVIEYEWICDIFSMIMWHSLLTVINHVGMTVMTHRNGLCHKPASEGVLISPVEEIPQEEVTIPISQKGASERSPTDR